VQPVFLLFFSYIERVFSYQVPSAFYYASTRMILAALTSLFFTVFLGPAFIKKLYEFKIGQSIRSEDCPVLGQLHEKKKDTPTMGGILILSSMILSLFLWMDLHSVFTWILLATTVFVGAIGAYDDYLKVKYKNSKGLRGKRKLAFQVLFASALAAYLLFPSINEAIDKTDWISTPSAKEQVYGAKEEVKSFSLSEYSLMYYLPFIKDPIFVLKGAGILLAFLFIIFVVTGSSNAVNLTDGLDGLAAGCLVMVSVVLALVAFFSNNIELSRYLNILYIEDSAEIAIFLFSLAGACLGFLWFNGSPAQVFMGDTGSLALGAILGVSATLLRREFLFALVGGVFVVETLSVIIQVAVFKLRNGKRVFLCTPLHHHFEYKKWPETKVVLRFWIVSLLLCLIGIMSLKLQ
jgi:phospho-N-acetylmuramoyl-pentapeptide-transferase